MRPTAAAAASLLALLGSGALAAASGASPLAAPLDPFAACTQARDAEDAEDDDAAAKAKREAEAKVAAETLRKALASEDAGERQTALREATERVHPLVIKEVARALADDDVRVLRTALDTLGKMQHDDSLAALRKYAKRERRALGEDVESNVILVRAIGRQASPKTTTWLARGALEEETFEMRQARIYSVANRRSQESLEALFDEMGRTDTRRLKGRMRELRPALVHLTGVDRGKDPVRWAAWWRENRRTFEIPAKTPELPEELVNPWRKFWGDPRTYERRKKRGERG